MLRGSGRFVSHLLHILVAFSITGRHGRQPWQVRKSKRLLCHTNRISTKSEVRGWNHAQRVQAPKQGVPCPSSLSGDPTCRLARCLDPSRWNKDLPQPCFQALTWSSGQLGKTHLAQQHAFCTRLRASSNWTKTTCSNILPTANAPLKCLELQHVFECTLQFGEFMRGENAE